MGNVQDTEANRVLVKRYLLSGVVMSRAAEAAFLRLKPDRILLPHGVYLTHGIAAKVARKLGIPVIAYRGGDRKHTLILSHNETYHRTLVNEPNDVWDKTDLTPAQRERTLSYVHAKRKGGADTFNYHPSPIEDTRMLYEQLGIDNKRPIVTLFTNVIWDAQIYYDGLAFSDILEWMRFSIEELAKNRNVWAVIRVHPAEVKGGLPTNQPILGEIHKWFPKLPDNFRVVPPESNLSSYTLGDHSKAAIIYGTKMGLELAVRGVPVIVAGETFSRNKGYGIDIASKEQYAALIARIHQIEPMSKERKERALRYAHYLYFRRFIDLPYLHMGDKERPGKHLEFASLEHLDPGRDEKLDVLCDAIIQLGPTHLPPNA